MSDNKVEVVYKIKDQASKIIKEIEKNFGKLNDSIKNQDGAEIGKVSKSLFNLNNVIKGLAIGKIVSMGTQLTKFVLNSASDMEELENVVTQVFGNMSDEVENFAQKMGAEMGRSTYSIKKYVSDMGSILKGMGGLDDKQILKMSQSLSTLAVDIGSFKNVSDEEAFNALRGGIVGETESLKRLGIVINETVMAEYARNKGLKQTWANLDATTKAELRYQKIMEATTFMQGDAARTIDSFANQLKALGANVSNLAVTIGSKFQDSASGFLQSVNKMLSATNNFLNKKTVSDYYSEFVKKSEEANFTIQRYVELCRQANNAPLSNEREKERLELFKKLQDEYPSIFSNLTSEKEKYLNVAKAIHEVNKQLADKVHNQLIDDRVKELNEEFKKLDNLKQDLTTSFIAKWNETSILSKLPVDFEFLEKMNRYAGYYQMGKKNEELENFLTSRISSFFDYGVTVDVKSDDFKKIMREVVGIYPFVEKYANDLKGINKNIEDFSKKVKNEKIALEASFGSKGNSNYQLIGELVEDTNKIRNSLATTIQSIQNLRIRGVDTTGFITLPKDNTTQQSSDDTKKPTKKVKGYFESLWDTLKSTLKNLRAKDNYYSKKIVANNSKVVKLQLEQLEKIQTTLSEQDYLSEKIKIYEEAIKTLEPSAKVGNKKALEYIETYKKEIEKLDKQKQEILDTEKFKSYIEKLESEILETNKTDFNTKQISELSKKLNSIYKKINDTIFDKGKFVLNVKDFGKTIEQLEKLKKEYSKTNEEEAKEIDETIKLLTFKREMNDKETSINIETLANNIRDMFNNLNVFEKEARELEKLKEKYTTDFELFKRTLQELPVELQKRVMEAKNPDEIKSIIDEAESSASESAKETLKIFKQTFGNFEKSAKDLKEASKKLSTQDIMNLTQKSFSSLKNSLSIIANKLPEAEKEIINSITETLDSFLELGTNIAKAVLDVNPQNILSAVDSGLKIISKIISGLISYFSKEEENISIKKFESRKREVELNNIKALQDLNKSIISLNNTLIKQASQNTSNDNLSKLEKLNDKLVKVFSNNFNATVSANGVKETDLKAGNGAWSLMGLSGGLPALFFWFTKLGKYKKEQIELNKKFSDVFDMEAKNSKELKEFYENTLSKMTDSDLTKHYDGYDPTKTSDNLKDFETGTFIDYKTTKSNIEEIKKEFLDHIKEVEKLENRVTEFKTSSILESFDGVSVVAIDEYKNQVLSMYEKILEGRTDKADILKKIKESLDEELKADKIVVSAFDDVRNTTIENLSKGNDMLNSLANGLQSYFNKIRNNLAKVKYDGVFRELEDEFNKSFEDISTKLKDFRLNEGKDLKQFVKNSGLSFSNLFGKVKDIEKINNDIKDVVSILREQARQSGLSDEYINMIFPIEDIKDKIFDVKTTLSNAMMSALDTNSFNQFSMSLGNSLYTSVRTSLIQAFSESETYRNLFDKYINTEEYKRELERATDFKEAYEILREQLIRTENMLEVNGLGFRATNASNGEYYGGFMSSNIDSSISRASLVGKGIGGISITLNIDNKGYLSTNELTEDLTKKIKEKLYDESSREV